VNALFGVEGRVVGRRSRDGRERLSAWRRKIPGECFNAGIFQAMELILGYALSPGKAALKTVPRNMAKILTKLAGV
jgi:hypothetical protein